MLNFSKNIHRRIDAEGKWSTYSRTNEMVIAEWNKHCLLYSMKENKAKLQYKDG